MSTLSPVPTAALKSPSSDYAGTLAGAWAEHLLPKAPGAPTVISTFAGCGGSSLGYSMAGYRELLAVEWDDNAVATFRRNFPAVPVYHGDIGKLSVADCLRLAGVAPGQLDVFDGSPPCQGFSTAGRRNFNDDRNQLFREYARLLRGLQPRAFVMENVSGMVKGKMKLIFADVMRELKACGYNVSARLLNAMYFDVPQSRQRLIFIGTRSDLAIPPSHPRAQSMPRTASQAIEGVANDESERQMLLEAGRKHAAYREWSLIPLGRRKADLSNQDSGFSAAKLHPHRPSRTIAKNDSAIGLHGLMHWAECRRFTTAEYKRLASFPDEFQFAGAWADAVARIGNSVPPLMMRAVAAHIRSNILER